MIRCSVQYANILYIESPSSVGFSRVDVKFWDYNDDFTADLNAKVLHEFMNRFELLSLTIEQLFWSVHPRYANRDFFITGESYGGRQRKKKTNSMNEAHISGVFVPYFARAILSALRDGNFTNSNFKVEFAQKFIDRVTFRVSPWVMRWSIRYQEEYLLLSKCLLWECYLRSD